MDSWRSPWSLLLALLLLLQFTAVAASEIACLSGGELAAIIFGCIFGTIVIFSLAQLSFWHVKKYYKGKTQQATVPLQLSSLNRTRLAYDNECFKNDHGQQHSVATTTNDHRSDKMQFANPKPIPRSEKPSYDTALRAKKKAGLNASNSGLVSRRSVESLVSMQEFARIRVPLKSQDFTGLGFTIYGNMREGIFVKDIMARGPAKDSSQIRPGDRVSSITIAFDNMAFEDALTILSYASPYSVELELHRDEAGVQKSAQSTLSRPAAPPEKSDARRKPQFHPLVRCQSMEDITATAATKRPNSVAESLDAIADAAKTRARSVASETTSRLMATKRSHAEHDRDKSHSPPSMVTSFPSNSAVVEAISHSPKSQRERHLAPVSFPENEYSNNAENNDRNSPKESIYIETSTIVGVEVTKIEEDSVSGTVVITPSEAVEADIAVRTSASPAVSQSIRPPATRADNDRNGHKSEVEVRPQEPPRLPNSVPPVDACPQLRDSYRALSKEEPRHGSKDCGGPKPSAATQIPTPRNETALRHLDKLKPLASPTVQSVSNSRKSSTASADKMSLSSYEDTDSLSGEDLSSSLEARRNRLKAHQQLLETEFEAFYNSRTWQQLQKKNQTPSERRDTSKEACNGGENSDSHATIDEVAPTEFSTFASKQSKTQRQPYLNKLQEIANAQLDSPLTSNSTQKHSDGFYACAESKLMLPGAGVKQAVSDIDQRCAPSKQGNASTNCKNHSEPVSRDRSQSPSKFFVRRESAPAPTNLKLIQPEAEKKNAPYAEPQQTVPLHKPSALYKPTPIREYNGVGTKQTPSMADVHNTTAPNHHSNASLSSTLQQSNLLPSETSPFSFFTPETRHITVEAKDAARVPSGLVKAKKTHFMGGSSTDASSTNGSLNGSLNGSHHEHFSGRAGDTDNNNNSHKAQKQQQLPISGSSPFVSTVTLDQLGTGKKPPVRKVSAGLELNVADSFSPFADGAVPTRKFSQGNGDVSVSYNGDKAISTATTLISARPFKPAASNLGADQYQKLRYFEQQLARQHEELAKLDVKVPSISANTS